MAHFDSHDGDEAVTDCHTPGQLNVCIGQFWTRYEPDALTCAVVPLARRVGFGNTCRGAQITFWRCVAESDRTNAGEVPFFLVPLVHYPTRGTRLSLLRVVNKGLLCQPFSL